MNDILKSLMIAAIGGITAGYMTGAVAVAKLETQMLWMQHTFEKMEDRLSYMEGRFYGYPIDRKRSVRTE